MLSILKYSLEIQDRQELILPFGSRIMDVQNQRETLAIWIMVPVPSNNMDKKATLEIVMFGTGFTVPEEISTWLFYRCVQMHDGDIVWHIFAREMPHE